MQYLNFEWEFLKEFTSFEKMEQHLDKINHVRAGATQLVVVGKPEVRRALGTYSGISKFLKRRMKAKDESARIV